MASVINTIEMRHYLNLVTSLFEYRRNADHPAQARTPTLTILSEYFGNPNYYISFTTIQKLGINPSSEYDTPIGIYTYPLEHISLNELKSLQDLPYAARSPYVWLIHAPNVKDLLDITFDEMQIATTKLIELLLQHGCSEEKLKNRARKAWNNTPGAILWAKTRAAASLLAEERFTNTEAKHAHILWTHLLRNVCGYAALSDKAGQGIIHPHEPMQAVFFGNSAFVDKPKMFRNVLENPNKQRHLDIHNKVVTGDALRTLLISNPMLIARVRSPSIELQLAVIKAEPYAIKNIRLPSAEAQLLAIESDPELIRYIEKPSAEAQLLAIESDPELIRYIPDSTAEAQLLAITSNPQLIGRIANPTEEVQLYAIKRSSIAFSDIAGPVFPSARALHKQLWMRY